MGSFGAFGVGANGCETAFLVAGAMISRAGKWVRFVGGAFSGPAEARWGRGSDVGGAPWLGGRRFSWVHELSSAREPSFFGTPTNLNNKLPLLETDGSNPGYTSGLTIITREFIS